MEKDLFAIVAAAGTGSRLGAPQRKAGVVIAGKALVVWTLEALRSCPHLAGGVLVVHEDDLATAQREWLPAAGLAGSGWEVSLGGKTRAESVRAGLALAPVTASRVLVHDAARPAVSAADLAAVVEAARESGAAILASAVADTLKRGRDGIIIESLERTGLYRAETPQV
ncbi:MAG: 2-C-methyl-D-erythritol 4-phosphate cytidylyltransferase, partial [Planctomycetes bacterium]|nr:2-C-methyl-D-erythritol 4-phosphate cytidylyltransferase [Planctomycetota bacterium]